MQSLLLGASSSHYSARHTGRRSDTLKRTYKGKKSNIFIYQGMSTDFEESEEGINLTFISQEYSPKTVSNPGVIKPAHLHPVRLSVKGIKGSILLLGV